MYVYTKDIVAFDIDTVNTKENMYIKGHWLHSYCLQCTCCIYISNVSKKLKIHYKGCNAVHVKGVQRSSKYTIRAVMPCMLKVSKGVQNTL